MPESRSRRSIRLRGYDYALAGAYFVTIVTRDRQCLFGDIVDDQTRLNLWGKIAQDEWQKSAQIRKEIELDIFIVMPNHIHGIIVITDATGRATGRSPLQSGPTKRSLGAFVGGFKSAITKRIGELRGLPRTPVWQRNYYETSYVTKNRFIAFANTFSTTPRDGSSIGKIPWRCNLSRRTHGDERRHDRVIR